MYGNLMGAHWDALNKAQKAYLDDKYVKIMQIRHFTRREMKEKWTWIPRQAAGVGMR